MHRQAVSALSLCIAILLIVAGSANAETRRDPATWILWRCGPIPFPSEMTPKIPELSPESLMDFGRFGEKLRIVVPTVADPSTDDRALRRMAELIVEKAPNAKIVSPEQVTEADRDNTLLLLGTLNDNPIVRETLGPDASKLMTDVKPGGYAIKPIASKTQGNRIVAVGIDTLGAWRAAAILAYSVHPTKENLGTLRNWSVTLPDGTYWLPFEAKYTVDANQYEVKPRTTADPPKPRVPFGVRIWGSPMPTLESYQRVIRALARTGMNTVVVQSGGWVDMPNAPDVFVKALDIAWQEGLYTILYVGNEELAHLPAPLSPAHRAVVMATKDHPGLLGWHLYNQLAAKLTDEQREMVREQMQWLRNISDKPIGNEVVWGHRLIPMPDDKIQLVRDLKAWGNDVIATDYAPIGGWTNTPELPNWELRLRELAKLDVPMEAVLQAHVPFLEPTVPSREQLRSQYWWSMAGGAQGFYIETAYLFTHFSVRGILSWTGEPLPDGRYDEVRELAALNDKLASMIADSRPCEESEAAPSQVILEPTKQNVALRLRRDGDHAWYAIVINGALDRDAAVRLTVASPDVAYRVTDVLTGANRGRFDASRHMAVAAPPGGGAVYRLERIKTEK